jgi:hypothetical protein
MRPDETHADQDRHEALPSFWASPSGWVAIGFIVVAGYFLVTEHAAHLASILPWLLIAACPLMHLFMHRGGHHHGGGSREPP